MQPALILRHLRPRRYPLLLRRLQQQQPPLPLQWHHLRHHHQFHRRRQWRVHSCTKDLFSAQAIWMYSLTRSTYRSSSVCSCDGKFVTDVDRAGFCGPRSLSVVAPANCVTVFVSHPNTDILFCKRIISLTAHSPMSAYEQKPLAGCMCLDHWGPVENSDLKVGASNWTDDTRVHIMQPDENCSPYLLEQWPYCRAQNFEDNTIDCDCQAWPEDNWLEPYQVNNPCIQAPYTTSVLATCIYL